MAGTGVGSGLRLESGLDVGELHLSTCHLFVTVEKNGNHIFPRPRIEPGPLDSKSYTLSRRYKSRLVPQGSTGVLYTYTQ